MLLVRAPLRITFGGGGTDLPSYASKYEGFCVSATISKYAYVGINPIFNSGTILRYSENESVISYDDIQHPIFREALKLSNITDPIEVVSIADVPSNGAGLGNSGAFTVALVKALAYYNRKALSPQRTARIACNINMGSLNKTQGKQDEYACAIGGINAFTFKKNGSVEYVPLEISNSTEVDLEENLLLFYSGVRHSTEEILGVQEDMTLRDYSPMVDSLHATKMMGSVAKNFLEAGDTQGFGDLLNQQWELKEKRMPWEDEELHSLHYGFNNHGAIGSKIIGSGNGGFFMVYAEDRRAVRNYALAHDLKELRFNFDFEGVKGIV